MSKRMLSLKKKIAVLAMGMSAVVVTTGFNGGCKNAIIAGTVGGIGDAAIASGVNSAFNQLNNTTVTNAAATPVKNALTTSWDNFVRVMFPITAVTQTIFAP